MVNTAVSPAIIKRRYARLEVEQIYPSGPMVHRLNQFVRLAREVAGKVNFRNLQQVTTAAKSTGLHSLYRVENPERRIYHQHHVLRDRIERDEVLAELVTFGERGNLSASEHAGPALSAVYAKEKFGIEDAETLRAIARHRGDALRSYEDLDRSPLTKILFAAFLLNGQKNYQVKALNLLRATGDLDLTIIYVLSSALAKGMPSAEVDYLQIQWARLFNEAEARIREAVGKKTFAPDVQNAVNKAVEEITANQKIITQRWETPHLLVPPTSSEEAGGSLVRTLIKVEGGRRRARPERVENILDFKGVELEGGVKISVVEPSSLNDYLRAQWNHARLFRIEGARSGVVSHIAVHRLMRVEHLGGRLWTIGGTRMDDRYVSVEESMWDALRLGRAMTYKCGASDIRIGGAKHDVYFDPDSPYKGSAIADVSRALEYLQVIFTGQDMNIKEEDARLMAHLAPHSIVGTPGLAMGGIEPTPPTALGVYLGMRALAGWLWPTETKKNPLEGRVVALQGAGGVGSKVIAYLLKDGARLIVTDEKKEVLGEVRRTYGEAVIIVDDPNAIYDQPGDIFSPNAIGAVLNAGTISRLTKAGFKLVAGAANNQLEKPEEDGTRLHDAGMLYAPDYVINQGGLDGVAATVARHDPMEKVKGVPGILLSIAERARADNVPTATAADRVIEERFERERWELING